MVGAMTRLRQVPWRALRLAAALLLPPTAGAAAQDSWESPEHSACLQRAAGAPEAALEEALAWEAAGGGPAALHCQAVALIGSGDYARAAALLEELPNALPGDAVDGRAALLGEAGNAWILANDMPRAVAAFDAAIALVPNAASLRIDRALALALAGDYWAAIDDLNVAEDLAPDRADLLIFRATAYRLLEVFDQISHDLLGQDRCFREQAVERVANQGPSRVTVRAMQLEIGVNYRVRSKVTLTLQVQQVLPFGDVQQLRLLGHGFHHLRFPFRRPLVGLL